MNVYEITTVEDAQNNKQRFFVATTPEASPREVINAPSIPSLGGSVTIGEAVVGIVREKSATQRVPGAWEVVADYEDGDWVIVSGGDCE